MKENKFKALKEMYNLSDEENTDEESTSTFKIGDTDNDSDEEYEFVDDEPIIGYHIRYYRCSNPYQHKITIYYDDFVPLTYLNFLKDYANYSESEQFNILANNDDIDYIDTFYLVKNVTPEDFMDPSTKIDYLQCTKAHKGKPF